MIHEMYKTSFFDDPEDIEYKLWKELPINNKKFSDVRLYEGLLFRKSTKTNFFKSRYFILFEDRLSFYKNRGDTKEKSYCILQNMRLEKIPTQIQGKDEKFGFRLTHNRQYTDFYVPSKEQQDKWILKLKQFCIMTNYSSNYINIKTIGKGSFAKVYLVKRKSDNADMAVKTFDKNALHNIDKAKASLINEINIMRKLDQENIIKLYEVHENDSFIFLVLELLKGGELFDRIIKKGAYTEKDACTLMKKLLTALDYMHSRGLMHRDLKLENLILKDTENDYDIKLADFGLASVVNQGEYLFKRCGTPGYVAPEILNDEKYDQKVDVFSAGVILYILLSGSSPFHGKTYNEILLKNKNCEIRFNFKEMGLRLSEQAIDLMKKMLERDPAVRIGSHQALEHEWMINGGNFETEKSSPVYLSSAQENMKKFQEENRFNVKNIKPKDLDRSLHCPSPIINGKMTTYVDSKAFGSPNSPGKRNSPSTGSYPSINNAQFMMGKKTNLKSKDSNNSNSTTGTTNKSGAISDVPNDEETDNMDEVSDEQNFIDSNINKYQYQDVMLISNIGSPDTLSSNSNTPQMFQDDKKTSQKRAMGIQTHLLSYVKDAPSDRTLKSNSVTSEKMDKQNDKANAVRTNLIKITEDNHNFYGSLDYIKMSPPK